MTTTVAERLRQGAGYVDRLVNDARQALPDGAAADVDAGIARFEHEVRRGMERGADVCDDVRSAIKRHPFATTAVAFGAGAVIGVAAAWLAGACARVTAPAARTDGEMDSEC